MITTHGFLLYRSLPLIFRSFSRYRNLVCLRVLFLCVCVFGSMKMNTYTHVILSLSPPSFSTASHPAPILQTPLLLPLLDCFVSG